MTKMSIFAMHIALKYIYIYITNYKSTTNKNFHYHLIQLTYFTIFIIYKFNTHEKSSLKIYILQYTKNTISKDM